MPVDDGTYLFAPFLTNAIGTLPGEYPAYLLDSDNGVVDHCYGSLVIAFHIEIFVAAFVKKCHAAFVLWFYYQCLFGLYQLAFKHCAVALVYSQSCLVVWHVMSDVSFGRTNLLQHPSALERECLLLVTA